MARLQRLLLISNYLNLSSHAEITKPGFVRYHSRAKPVVDECALTTQFYAGLKFCWP